MFRWNNDLDWTVDANGTPSNNTGPSSAIEGDFYIYVEASGNGTGFPSKRAILNSPCFNLSGLTEATFSFNYHQFGSSNMGVIDLEISTDNGSSWASLWNSSDNQGNSWLTENIDLTPFVGGSILLRFNRLTGSTWQADIAIDNISLFEGQPSGGNGCTNGISSYPYTEGFENTLGGWTQSTNDDINWTVDANGTPSNNTGPSSAIEGDFYIYVEASGNNVGFPNKRAILNSPCFDLSGQSTATFSFNYHQFGSTNMGTITLEASNNDGSSWDTVWSSSGNLGNSWQSASVDLSSYVGDDGLRLRFNRVTGTTWQADIAIDNVSLTTNSTEVLVRNVGSQDVIKGISDQLILYPNPVKGETLYLETNMTRVSYRIFNVSGQLVGQGELAGNRIDIGRLESGIYRIQLISEKQRIITKQFVKE